MIPCVSDWTTPCFSDCRIPCVSDCMIPCVSDCRNPSARRHDVVVLDVNAWGAYCMLMTEFYEYYPAD